MALSASVLFCRLHSFAEKGIRSRSNKLTIALPAAKTGWSWCSCPLCCRPWAGKSWAGSADGRPDRQAPQASGAACCGRTPWDKVHLHRGVPGAAQYAPLDHSPALSPVSSVWLHLHMCMSASSAVCSDDWPASSSTIVTTEQLQPLAAGRWSPACSAGTPAWSSCRMARRHTSIRPEAAHQVCQGPVPGCGLQQHRDGGGRGVCQALP